MEESTEQGPVKFYADAEAVLTRLPRRGMAMVLKLGRDGVAEPYDRHDMAKLVRKLRERLGLPVTFTLDACRHGGMTELEEAELTDGQGRALSGHRITACFRETCAETCARRAYESCQPRFDFELKAPV